MFILSFCKNNESPLLVFVAGDDFEHWIEPNVLKVMKLDLR